MSLINKLIKDPTTQKKFHLNATLFWIINVPIVLVVFYIFPAIWEKYSVIYLVLASLYANIATEFGSVASSEAAEFSEVKNLEIDHADKVTIDDHEKESHTNNTNQ
jgi:hypothetical protein